MGKEKVRCDKSFISGRMDSQDNSGVFHLISKYRVVDERLAQNRSPDVYSRFGYFLLYHVDLPIHQSIIHLYPHLRSIVRE